MWRHYNKHVKRFYEEKGLSFVPPSAWRAYNASDGLVNNSKKTALHRRARVPAAVAHELEPSAIVSSHSVLQGSNDPVVMSARSIQRSFTPQPRKKTKKDFTDATMPEPGDDGAKLRRDQDEKLLRLLSKRTETKTKSMLTDFIFDFEKKGKT
jgi:hypothetical protein